MTKTQTVVVIVIREAVKIDTKNKKSNATIVYYAGSKVRNIKTADNFFLYSIKYFV